MAYAEACRTSTIQSADGMPTFRKQTELLPIHLTRVAAKNIIISLITIMFVFSVHCFAYLFYRWCWFYQSSSRIFNSFGFTFLYAAKVAF